MRSDAAVARLRDASRRRRSRAVGVGSRCPHLDLRGPGGAARGRCRRPRPAPSPPRRAPRCRCRGPAGASPLRPRRPRRPARREAEPHQPSSCSDRPLSGPRRRAAPPRRRRPRSRWSPSVPTRSPGTHGSIGRCPTSTPASRCAPRLDPRRGHAWVVGCSRTLAGAAALVAHLLRVGPDLSHVRVRPDAPGGDHSLGLPDARRPHRRSLPGAAGADLRRSPWS